MVFADSWKLLGVQLIAHASIVPMLWWGKPQHYLVAFLVYFSTGCLGMSMTFHRLIAHRAWAAPAWFKILGCLCGTVGLTGSCISWATVHREHHRHADTPSDPHSPVVFGFFKAQFLSMFFRPNPFAVRPFIKDRVLRVFHRFYWPINLTYGITLLALDPFAMVYAYLFPACILWNSGSLVNTIGHTWGYRSHRLRDNSRNNYLLALLTWGEGWHNNHHQYPGRSRFGEKPWEIDVSWRLIQVLQRQSGQKNGD